MNQLKIHRCNRYHSCSFIDKYVYNDPCFRVITGGQAAILTD